MYIHIFNILKKLINAFFVFVLNIKKIIVVVFSSIAQQLSGPGPATPLETLTIPTSESLDKIFSPKLEKIATEISTLNLLEVSELSQLLKKRLNLPDQPMMPANFSMQAFAPSENQDEVTTIAAKVQTEFTVSILNP